MTFTLSDDLRARITALHEEGRAIFERFEREVRSVAFHPFKPADYSAMVDMLLPFTGRNLSFLEWGSATGVIAITADLLGFDACGIEIDPNLVDIARDLAARYDSKAQFAAGSLFPDDYEWRAPSGDPRLGTLESGVSGYEILGRNLDEFDLVYGYAWTGEDDIMRDVMQKRGREGARLLLNGAGNIRIYEVRRGHSP